VACASVSHSTLSGLLKLVRHAVQLHLHNVHANHDVKAFDMRLFLNLIFFRGGDYSRLQVETRT
jgi:hypothetical protein